MATARIPNVLIADDNADLGSLLAGILRRSGFDVDVCQDADVAIRSATDNTYSAILVEPSPAAGFRPLLDFLEARERHGLDGVVMATTETAESLGSEWWKRGVFDIIRKPLTPERVRTAITACASHRGAIPAHEAPKHV